MSVPEPNVKFLVLDAGPLLSLAPLRGLAQRYLTVPQVLEELKDKKAREHFERLGLSAGVNVEVRSPDPVSLAKVTLFSKKTGDYSVLSHPDLCVLALTYALHEEEKQNQSKEEANPQTAEDTSIPLQSEPEQTDVTIKDQNAIEEIVEGPEEGEDQIEEATEGVEKISLANEDDADDPQVEREPLWTEPPSRPQPASDTSSSSQKPLFEDPPSSDDGEGEWITPSNVAVHKSRALSLLPTSAPSSQKGQAEKVAVGCMTADFAMQNVLLHMGLNLVGLEGRRIASAKSWVLRCHACFKLCKDSSKQFCPSCGNPTLLRTSITTHAATPTSPARIQIHLKKNFQYRTRGTIYSIPSPKPGTSKTGGGTGLVLREDQPEYMRAVKKEEGRAMREEKRMMKTLADAKDGSGVKVGNWTDPDWMPSMFNEKQHRTRDAVLPQIGHGKKNPNERKRRK